MDMNNVLINIHVIIIARALILFEFILSLPLIHIHTHTHQMKSSSELAFMVNLETLINVIKTGDVYSCVYFIYSSYQPSLSLSIYLPVCYVFVFAPLD